MKKLEEIEEMARQLCYKIEELPASHNQTNCSLQASNLRQKISEFKELCIKLVN